MVRLCGTETFNTEIMSTLMEHINELSNEPGMKHMDAIDYAARWPFR